VWRSSGGSAARERGAASGGGRCLPPAMSERAALTPSAPRPVWTSLADRSWRPSLFTGCARTTARGLGASRGARSPRASSRRDGAEHVRLDQVIPTAGAAYLHHVYGEFVVAGREQDQLLSAAGRSGHGAQVVTEDPRHQGELLLATDRAHHRTGLPMELRGSQQVGVGVTDLRDAGAPRVDLSQ
jgi:hypothetical protein